MFVAVSYTHLDVYKRQLYERHQHLTFRCVLNGSADIELDRSGARHSHLALVETGRTSGEIAA